MPPGEEPKGGRFRVLVAGAQAGGFGLLRCRILDLIRRTASARVALRLLRMMAWGSSVPSSPALRAPLCGFGA